MAGPEVSSIWRFHGEATPNRFMFGGSNFLQFTKKKKKKEVSNQFSLICKVSRWFSFLNEVSIEE